MKKHFVNSLVMLLGVILLAGCMTTGEGGYYSPAPIQVQHQVRPMVVVPTPVIVAPTPTILFPPVAVIISGGGYGCNNGYQHQQHRHNYPNYQRYYPNYQRYSSPIRPIPHW